MLAPSLWVAIRTPVAAMGGREAGAGEGGGAGAGEGGRAGDVAAAPFELFGPWAPWVPFGPAPFRPATFGLRPLVEVAGPVTSPAGAAGVAA